MKEWKRYCVKSGNEWTEKLSDIDRTYKEKIDFEQYAKMPIRSGYREKNQNLIKEKMYDTSTAKGGYGAILSCNIMVC